MTEQEKREKAIEEMCDCACSNCKHFPQCDDITCEEIIKALYDARLSQRGRSEEGNGERDTS